MKNFLLPNFNRIATYAMVVVIFTHNVLFDRDVFCTCKDQSFHCDLYISIPVFVITFLLLWTDEVFKRVSRYRCAYSCPAKLKDDFLNCIFGKDRETCSFKCVGHRVLACWSLFKRVIQIIKTFCCVENLIQKRVSQCKNCFFCSNTEHTCDCQCVDRWDLKCCPLIFNPILKLIDLCSNKFFCVAFLQFLKAFCVGLLWIVSLLIDGDWYACCRNGLSGEEAQIPCKKQKDRTDEDQVKLDNLKNESKVIGFFILLVILFLAVCTSSIKWRKCCEKPCTCCDRNVLYELVILDKEENIQEEYLKQEAIKELTTKLHQIKNPGNIFDIAEELIEQRNQGNVGANELQENGEANHEQQEEIDTEPLLSQSASSKIK